MKYISVLVTYNRKEKLIGAIKSLLSQTLQPQKIVLIDNCSTDGTKELLKNKGLLDNPVIDYNLMDKNYGGSGGFYYGIKRALKFKDYDYLSLSDDDAFFDKNYFELIDKVASLHPSVHAFCGTVEYKDGSIQLDHRRKIINRKWIREKEFPISTYNKDFFVDTFSFVGCVISREIIKKIGLPSKNYFIYYDDTEYSLRVRENTKILNVSNAIITHMIQKKSFENKNIISWKNYYEIRNSMLMKMKHSNWKFLRLYFLYRQLHLIAYVLLSRRYSGIRRRAMYIYNSGFKDALHNITGKREPFVPGRKLPY